MVVIVAVANNVVAMLTCCTWLPWQSMWLLCLPNCYSYCSCTCLPWYLLLLLCLPVRVVVVVVVAGPLAACCGPPVSAYVPLAALCAVSAVWLQQSSLHPVHPPLRLPGPISEPGLCVLVSTCHTLAANSYNVQQQVV